MITRLEAIRYRCFERLGIDLGEFRVIVGANGAGKTTLLDIPVLLGELLQADNLTSVFLVRSGEKPARASSLRELIFSGRGDDFSLMIEARLPEDIQKQWVDSLIARADPKTKAGKLIAKLDRMDPEEAVRQHPERWPTHIRYELRLEVFNERELQVKNEYLFVFPEANGPDRSQGGLFGEQVEDQEHWHFILRREYGGPAEFRTEADPLQGSGTRVETVRIKSNLLAMSAVKYRADAYPAATWLYELLTERSVFLDPDWGKLRAASPPGQDKSIIPSALNLPWLALDLKNIGSTEHDTEGLETPYRSRDYQDWVDHVKTALPQVEDVDVREREEDHHAYFTIRYAGGYSVTSSGLSDGTLRILTLTLLAYVTDPPALVVTEEPENGIHPSGIEAILQSLSSLYDSQVWVSSHSPVVLANTPLHQVICARMTPSGGVELVAGNEHPRLKDWHGAIDLGSLFAAGILG